MATQSPSSRAGSEPRAMQAVEAALLPLSPDARARVLRWAADRFAVPNVTVVVGSSDGRRQEGQPTPPDREKPADIETFLSSKEPGNLYQRLACLAYYLSRWGGKTDVKTKDLRKANIDASQQRISNPSVSLTRATLRYGFFTPSGRGSKRLTSRGKAVVEALPDPAAVSQALQRHPLPKGPGRRGAKKTA